MSHTAENDVDRHGSWSKEHQRYEDGCREDRPHAPTAENDPPRPLCADDGKPGCPVTVWDGPYRMRCSLGASVGRCAYHGPFARVTSPEVGDES
jgi:hypothetical protein